jgi:hypothetical protein
MMRRKAVTTTRTGTDKCRETSTLCRVLKQDVYILFMAPRRRIPNLGILIGIFRMLCRERNIKKANTPMRYVNRILLIIQFSE